VSKDTEGAAVYSGLTHFPPPPYKIYGTFSSVSVSSVTKWHPLMSRTIYAAWWLFVISMATTSALSLASSGSSITSTSELLETYLHGEDEGGFSKPTYRNWLLQRLSVVAVAFSLIGAAGGWALLAAGLVGVNLHFELDGKGPYISGGPDRGEHGIDLASRLVTYLIIGIFCVFLIGGYFLRLRPRFHAARTSFAIGDPMI